MKPILYLDMDGVLFDMEGYIVNTLGLPEETLIIEEEWVSKIEEVEYDRGFFRNLPTLPILHYLKKHYSKINEKYDIRFLTYVGNHRRIRTVIDDKKTALKAQGLNPDHMIAVTCNKDNKQFFSNKNSILLDDSSSTIELFRARGGRGYVIDPSLRETSIDGMNHFLLQLQLKP